MNGINFEINDKKSVEKLGFEYADDEEKCRGHMFNNIPVELDLRNIPGYSLTNIEKDLDRIFRTVLKWELEDAGVKKLRRVEWDRFFVIGPLWDVRQFTARYYVRILSEDKEEKDNHVIKA